MKYRSKKSFVYDATLHENINNESHNMLSPNYGYNANETQNNQNVNIHQNMNYQQIERINYFSI